MLPPGHNAAVTDRATEFGRELRRRREAAGLSLTAFTARVHYSKSHLSKVENGHATANREFAVACDSVLHAGGALAALVAVPEPVGFSGLPAVTSHFTGRDEELRRINAALVGGSASVCVLDGMAGVGKTALALRAAWTAETHFPDGCLFLDLRGFTPGDTGPTGDDVLDRLLRMLGVPAEDAPRDEDGRANFYRDRLRGKRMLLVFDNVRSARQVLPLLPAEPRCRVLITSRNRLNALDDAVHVSVGMLSTAQAVELFRAVAGERVPPADDGVVERIVEHCGRLPLAVRIAAARFRGSPMWTLPDFVARLADETVRLGTLDDGERSVTAAFTLSYRGLAADQRRMFGLLALHPGREVGVRSAAALAGVGLAEAERLLARLYDAYLVTQRPGGYTGFHDLMRAFALEHALPAIPADDRDAAVRRLSDLALATTAASDELLVPQRYRPALELDDPPPVVEGFTDAESALAWLDAEWPNLVALCGMASAKGWHRKCWQLAFLLRDFFFRAKLWDAWIHTHRLAAAAARAAGDVNALAMTLNNLGMAHVDRGDLEAASEHYEEALALFRSSADEHGTTSALSNLAWVNLYLGEHRKALRDMGTALESYRRSGSRRNAAITLRGMALTETELGAFEDAVRHGVEAHDEFVALGLDLDLAMALNCLAWTHFRAGRPDEAVAWYDRAAEQAARCGSVHEVARAETGLANAAATTGDQDTAHRLWTSAAGTPLDPVMVGEERVRRALIAG